jgi:flagellum-specific peptidoglycan hydrolase FlgJ
MKPIFIVSSLMLLVQTCFAQIKQDIENYIAKYKDIALQEMVRCKIPASITLAQGLHESSYGKSKLSTEANNHFGIKCKDEWDGKKFYQNDDAPNECFRVYDHAEDSYADHSDFLITRPRYAELFQITITDYKEWARGLKACGYATNPRYAEILIKTIEDYNLAAYDQQGLAMIAAQEKQFLPATTAPETQPVAVIPEKQKPSPVAAAEPASTRHITFAKASSTGFVTVHDESGKKEIVVNGCKAIKADGTVDPLAIAYNYQIQYSQVLAFNDMNEGDKFKDGENIFLQPKRAKGTDPVYIVQPGESMRSIAQKFGIKLKDLYQKNLMVLNDQAMAGETIYLQEKRPGPPRTMAYSDFLKSQTQGSINSNSNTNTASASANTSVPQITKQTDTEQYTVSHSDTLYSIAKKFNTTVQQLRALNNLDNTDLHPGQTLVISK